MTVTPQTAFDDLPTFLKIGEVAAFTRRHRATVFGWMRKNGRGGKYLRSTRIGKRRMVRKADLKLFLALP